MNNKLLDDALAAGFCTIGDEIYTCEQYEARNITKELAKFAALQQPQESKETALQQYNALTVGSVDPDPIERLRFFLSISLKGQDWLDVEKFIDDLQIPDGYTLVPIEPTDEMIDAAMSRYKHQSDSQAYAFKEMHRLNFRYDYKAMIDVSPPTNTEDI